MVRTLSCFDHVGLAQSDRRQLHNEIHRVAILTTGTVFLEAVHVPSLIIVALGYPFSNVGVPLVR